jgi:hypothetical protein
MASNYIPIDQSKRLGSRLRRTVDLARELLDMLTETKAVMEAQIDATDYTAVEAQYGVPAGKGQTAYNLVAGAKSVIDVSAVRQMVDWLG